MPINKPFLFDSDSLKNFHKRIFFSVIVFLLLINLIVVFLSIFSGNITRQLEIANYQIKINIDEEIEQLQVNKIELSFYNNLDYLRKLHNIYFSIDESYPEKNILSLSNISDTTKERVFLVKIN